MKVLFAMTSASIQNEKRNFVCYVKCYENYMPIFHKYLRRKAEVMGYKNGLPWYELFSHQWEKQIRNSHNSKQQKTI